MAVEEEGMRNTEIWIAKRKAMDKNTGSIAQYTRACPIV